MFSITDGILFVVFIYLVGTGWQKGLLRTFIGPIVLITSILLSTLYFSLTKNLLGSFLIGLLGPFVLLIISSAAISSWHKIHNDDPKKINALSRLAGSLINVFWKGTLILGLLFFITILPEQFSAFSKIKNGIQESFTYKLLEVHVHNHFPIITSMENVVTSLKSPAVMKSIQNNPQLLEKFDNFYKDPRINTIVSDQAILDKYSKEGITSILADPKIKKIYSDPELIKTFMNINTSILKELSQQQKDELLSDTE